MTRLDESFRPTFFITGNERYGIGVVARTLAKNLAARGARPSVVTLREGEFMEWCRGLDFEVLSLDAPIAPKFHGGALRAARGVFSLRQWERDVAPLLQGALRQLGSSALVVQRPNHVSLAGRSASAAGIPCFWMMANVISNRWPLGLNRRYYKSLCRRWSVAPLPNSRFTGSTLDVTIANRVLYLGADEEQFDPTRVTPVDRAELGLSKDRTVFGIHARLHPSKGQEEFLTAMLDAVERGHDLELLLVGGPAKSDFADKLQGIATDRGMADRLHFVDWTDAPEKYYGSIDIAVNALVGAEGFGLSVVEAMLMQKPVLAHAAGGPAETVIDGETGWHVVNATREGWLCGIESVIADQSKWPQFGGTGRARALEQFSTPVFVSRFIDRVKEHASSMPF